MNYPILIVGAEVNVHELIMYKADGETITMKQGDPRIRDLVAKLAVALENFPNQYWLTEEDMSGKNHFAEAEKKTNGLVRFFKVAKAKLQEIAEKFLEPLAPMELGAKPKPNEPVHFVNGEPVEELDDFPGVEDEAPQLPPVEQRPLTKSDLAVAEIMANAVTTSDAKFAEVNKTAGEETTIVAVTSDNTVIPGVEQISNQMQAVSESVSSANGLSKFFERMATVKRGHSVEDLLKFMEKGELPVADDGSVLVYKRLQSTGEEGVYVDVHSKKVKQRVGSLVHMAEHMVDPNRSQDCSNGLHVARRDYLNAFSGNVCVLAKLAPEDVIAVPQYDARKLRAKAYHIIAVLSHTDATRVCNNQPMLDTKLLADAVAGNHVGILEYVEITEAKGGGLKVTPASEVTAVPTVDTSDRNVQSLDHLPGMTEQSSQVDARKLALDLAAPGTSDSTVAVTFGDGTVTHVEQRDTPKGVPGGYADGDLWKNGNDQMVYAPPGKTFVCQVDESCGQANPVPAPKETWVERANAEGKVSSAVVPNSTKRPIDIFVQNFRNSAGNPVENLSAARALLAYKKQCKKSWTALGVSIDDYEAAMKVVADAGMGVKAVADTLPKAVPPNDDKHFSVLAGNNDGLSAKPAKVKKAAPPLKVPVTKTKDKPTTKTKVKPVETEVKRDPLPKVPGKRSQKEEAAHLLDIYTKNPDYTNCKQLVAFKKAAKKGWTALGIDESIGKKAEARVKL